MIISTAEEVNPLRRCTMEDVHQVLFNKSQTLCPTTGHPIATRTTYVGVYDGHGGREIVDFLNCTFPEIVADEVFFDNEDDDAHAPISQRLERAFLLADIQARMMGLCNSGATVALCLIEEQERKKNRTIHAANVGDACIVLGRRISENEMSDSQHSQTEQAQLVSSRLGTPPSRLYAVKRLSQDHKAEDSNEAERIRQNGGIVLKDRVMGLLAVTRSIGDHEWKRWVLGQPHVESCYDAKVGDVLIIACDGLTDVMSDQQIVEFVFRFERSNFGRHHDPTSNDDTQKQVARALISEALKRGSTDNITVVVVYL